MQSVIKYRQIVKSIIQKYVELRTSLSDGYDSQVLFDDERGHYLVLDWGWNGDKDLHLKPIHIDLIDRKIWIQYDNTEEGIVTDLLEAGVKKEDIVLSFFHSKIRQHTGLAVAWFWDFSVVVYRL